MADGESTTSGDAMGNKAGKLALKPKEIAAAQAGTRCEQPGGLAPAVSSGGAASGGKGARLLSSLDRQTLRPAPPTAVTPDEIEALYLHFMSLKDEAMAAPKGMGHVVNLTCVSRAEAARPPGKHRGTRRASVLESCARTGPRN